MLTFCDPSVAFRYNFVILGIVVKKISRYMKTQNKQNCSFPHISKSTSSTNFQVHIKYTMYNNNNIINK